MTPEHLEGIVRAFGPSLSVALNVPKQLIPIPEVMAFLEIRNRQVVESILTMVMDQSELEWRTTTSQDCEIHYANAKVDDVMLSPCFTFDDGMLLVSSHVRNLKAALGRRGSPEQSLAMIRSVLGDTRGPAHDIVCLNAGATIYVAGLADSHAEGVAVAQRAITSGSASSTLDKLVEVSNA